MGDIEYGEPFTLTKQPNRFHNERMVEGIMRIADFERKQKYFDAFWEKEIIDRPLLCVKAPLKPQLPVSQPGRGGRTSGVFKEKYLILLLYSSFIKTYKIGGRT